MPTESLELLLSRDRDRLAACGVIGTASPLLQELVNFGTHALARFADTWRQQERDIPLAERDEHRDHHVSLFTLYWQLIGLTDAIEVLVSQSCSLSIVPLLRSSFEMLLSLEYLLADPHPDRARSQAWLVAHIRRRASGWQDLDPSTERGRQFKEDRANDRVLSSVSIPEALVSRAQERAAFYKRWLAKPYLASIDDRLAPKAEWYSLDRGPTNLYQLARHLRRGGLYGLLYRAWSAQVHGADATIAVCKGAEGRGTFSRTRDARDLAWYAFLTARFMLDATWLLLKHVRPGEETATARWYEREVREPCRRLQAMSASSPHFES